VFGEEQLLVFGEEQLAAATATRMPTDHMERAA